MTFWQVYTASFWNWIGITVGLGIVLPLLIEAAANAAGVIIMCFRQARK